MLIKKDFSCVNIFSIKVAQVRKVARQNGVSDKGRKMEVIGRLKDVLKETSVFNKVLSALWGSSGIY
jgi:hypothetical protein